MKTALWNLGVHTISAIGSKTGLTNKLERHHRRRILIYHDIPKDMVSNFNKQITYLVNHCDIVPLKQLLDDPDQTQSNSCSLSLTFDDAYLSIYENAIPVLARHNIVSTVFAPVGFIETNSPEEFRVKNLLVKNEELPMSWEQLRELVRMNHEIGSHSWNHVNFGQPNVDFKKELYESKEELERQLNCKIDSFAFPFGKSRNFNENAIQAVSQAGYRYCFSGISGDAKKSDRIINRTYINPGWSMDLFRSAFVGLFDRLVL